MALSYSNAHPFFFLAFVPVSSSLPCLPSFLRLTTDAATKARTRRWARKGVFMKSVRRRFLKRGPGNGGLFSSLPLLSSFPFLLPFIPVYSFLSIPLPFVHSFPPIPSFDCSFPLTPAIPSLLCFFPSSLPLFSSFPPLPLFPSFPLFPAFPFVLPGGGAKQRAERAKRLLWRRCRRLLREIDPCFAEWEDYVLQITRMESDHPEDKVCYTK